jgi:hypothetical protein
MLLLSLVDVHFLAADSTRGRPEEELGSEPESLV